MSHWTSSAVSAAYAAFRPTYPPALFAAVARRCAHRDLVVDVGCGNGQATQSLLEHFANVVGVDPSPSQIQHAPRDEKRARYIVAGAESFAPLVHPSGALHQADCVTVAQAIHWFNMPSFMDQVAQTLKEQPGTVLAFWSYPLCTITSHPAVDILLKELDAMLMRDGHWPVERKHVDDHYAHIWVPEYFPSDTWDREVEVFPVHKSVSLGDFVSYLSTMSGVTRWYQRQQEEGGGSKDLLAEFHAAALASMQRSAEEDGADAATLSVVFNMETYFAVRK